MARRLLPTTSDGWSAGSCYSRVGSQEIQEEMNMFKRTILALSVAALAITGVAQAQENATLTLRSGERISGQLVDMGGSGFAVRVNGQDRNIGTNDVAVIDFSGSAAT